TRHASGRMYFSPACLDDVRLRIWIAPTEENLFTLAAGSSERTSNRSPVLRSLGETQSRLGSDSSRREGRKSLARRFCPTTGSARRPSLIGRDAHSTPKEPWRALDGCDCAANQARVGMAG